MIERKLSNNFTPERIERKLFRKSPLGTRIADDIISPLSTKELLSRKKTQARKIYLEGEELKTIITRNYTLEKYLNEKRTCKRLIIIIQMIVIQVTKLL